MITQTHRSLFLAAGCTALVGMLCGDPAIVQAEEEANTATKLANAPAVRHRLLLVKGRIELSPTFESTINADFRNTIGLGLKAEYHFSDMFSVGAVGVFGASINTSLVNRILTTLPADPPADDTDPTPTKAEFEQHLNSMPIHGAAYVSITPWYGKLAAFGKAFVNFDFYFQGGLAFAQLTNNCQPNICYDDNPLPAEPVIDEDTGEVLAPDNDPNNDFPLNDGFKPGLYLGGGIHVFINEFIALDFTVRDYLFSDNPSGLDFNADLGVGTNERTGNSDKRFLNHLFVGLGVSIFLPPKAVRTN